MAKNELTESELPSEHCNGAATSPGTRGGKRSRYWSVSCTRKPESDHKRTKAFDNAREQRAV